MDRASLAQGVWGRRIRYRRDADLEGRVGKEDFVSLNGSLAPANTINNIVREIPVVGKILTGKKGDGIFGASFKIKGKDNLKVEVNPIKTLTPRFIQRFLKILKKIDFGRFSKFVYPIALRLKTKPEHSQQSALLMPPRCHRASRRLPVKIQSRR